MNTIHPTAVLNGDIRMGEDNVIGAFVVITGPVVIGNRNYIGSGAIVGAPPEVRDFPHPGRDRPSSGDGRPAGVVIGDRTTVREQAQIHQGWQRATTVGDDAFIMNQAYLAHDVQLARGVTVAGGVRLAGHVVVGDGANIGLGALVHQRRTIGAGAMVGMGAVVTRDVPAFAKAFGSPARVRDVNRRGAEAAGLSVEEIERLRERFADAPRSAVADGRDPV